MEKIEKITSFFKAIQTDPRISATHIAIFTAIVNYWCNQGFQLPVQAYSYEIMPLAKLNSNNTYHRKLRELSEYGYIRYEPSFKRNRRSKFLFPEYPDQQATEIIV